MTTPHANRRKQLATLLVVWWCLSVVDGNAGEFSRAPDLAGRSRSPAYGRSGIVASGQPQATTIGIDVLKSGGNAADAAVAVAAALSVLEPMQGGPGGDVSLLYWDAKAKRLFGLESTGAVPKGLPDALKSSGSEKPDPNPEDAKGVDPADGEAPKDTSIEASVKPSPALMWTVPGAVDGWFRLHSRFGSRPWDDCLQPAITVAREGFFLTPSAAVEWSRQKSRLSGPGADGLCSADQSTEPGILFKNEDLARTLSAIAAGGRDAFYEGDLCQTLVAFAKGQGGVLTLADMGSHQASWVEATTMSYRDHAVSTLTTTETGTAFLESLGILASYQLQEIGRQSPQYWHLITEARRLALSDAASGLAVVDRLSAENLAKRRRVIDPNKAPTEASRVIGTDAYRGSAVVVVDGQGNGCVLVQDLGQAFGTGVVPGAMGFVMQSRVALDGESVPLVTPHSRLCGVTMRGAEPVGFFAVTSDSAAVELAAQAVVSLVDFSMDAQSTLDAARIGYRGEKLLVEDGVSDELIKELAGRGHPITREQASELGEVHLVVRRSGAEAAGGATLTGGSDPRRDASSLAY